MTDVGLIAIGAGIAVCAGLGTGIGEGICASKAVEALEILKWKVKLER